MAAGAVAAAIGLGILLAYLAQQQPQPPAEEQTGVQVILPPIPLSGEADTESTLSKLQPTIRPRFLPPGWTVEWPSVELPTQFGTAAFQIAPTELPLLPRGEVERLVRQMRPQLVHTEDGLAVQVTTTIPT